MAPLAHPDPFPNTAKLDGMTTVIPCPDEGCKFALYPDDVERLARPEDYARFRALREADYKTRLANLAEEDESFAAMVNSDCIPCPRCSVIVFRYDGCDYIQCICGSQFCYLCAKEYNLETGNCGCQEEA